MYSDPFEGLVLPSFRARGANASAGQGYSSPRRQLAYPGYDQPQYPQPSTKPLNPGPDIFRWDPMASDKFRPPQPTIFRWDPNAQPQPRPQPPRPVQPGNETAYNRPNVDRFGPRPSY